MAVAMGRRLGISGERWWAWQGGRDDITVGQARLGTSVGAGGPDGSVVRGMASWP
jgi:hypothetical protein